MTEEAMPEAGLFFCPIISLSDSDDDNMDSHSFEIAKTTDFGHHLCSRLRRDG